MTTFALPEALITSRLVLRRWRLEDREPFAAMNADPRVMEFMPETLSREKSDALAARVDQMFDVRGYGLWAVELRSTSEFIGWTGLSQPTWNAHFTPAVEVGWRIAAAHWNQGYATEAARVALSDGFARVGLDGVVSFTTYANHRSRRVMEKLGMRHEPREDFAHPALPVDHPLCPHVLYRLRASEFGDVR
ncbi:MAG: GNAT family N-acetyltransferase [Acidimicrobiia bacterium]